MRWRRGSRSSRAVATQRCVCSLVFVRRLQLPADVALVLRRQIADLVFALVRLAPLNHAARAKHLRHGRPEPFASQQTWLRSVVSASVSPRSDILFASWVVLLRLTHFLGRKQSARSGGATQISTEINSLPIESWIRDSTIHNSGFTIQGFAIQGFTIQDSRFKDSRFKDSRFMDSRFKDSRFKDSR